MGNITKIKLNAILRDRDNKEIDYTPTGIIIEEFHQNMMKDIEELDKELKKEKLEFESEKFKIILTNIANKGKGKGMG